MAYRQAMEVLNDTYVTLLQILDIRLEQNTREQLELLMDGLAVVVARTTAADDDSDATDHTASALRHAARLVQGGCQHRANADLQKLMRGAATCR